MGNQEGEVGKDQDRRIKYLYYYLFNSKIIIHALSVVRGVMQQMTVDHLGEIILIISLEIVIIIIILDACHQCG